MPPQDAASAPLLTVMTVNTHKGFTSFNRRFILPELRDAVRAVGADVVFLQEVLGTHEEHSRTWAGNWPETPQDVYLVCVHLGLAESHRRRQL